MTPWAVACQVPPSLDSLGLNTGVHKLFLSPGDLLSPGIEPRSALQADSLPSEPPGKPQVFLRSSQSWEPLNYRFRSEVKWKSLSCVQLFVSPWTIQSMESSRPEYWSGYPFPSPGTSEVVQLGLTLCDPMDYSLPGSFIHGIPFFRGSSQTRDRTQVSCIAGRFFFFLQADSLPAEQAPANKITVLLLTNDCWTGL